MQKSRVLVVGLGKTGLSIARHLSREQTPFILFDTRKAPAGLAEFQTLFPDTVVYLEHFPAEEFQHVSLVITSPGVPLETEVLQKAREFNIPIIGDIECFARVVRAPVIAITGTNGKSTVTTLVGEMAKAAGFSVAVAGNIGTPVLDRLDDGIAYDLWVLELSSFQLDLIESLTPIAATILNVTPDHLDRHHTMAAYCAAKQRVYLHAQISVYNRDDQQTVPKQITGRSYGLDAPPSALDWGLCQNKQGDYYLCQGETLVFPVASLLLKGRHNWLNALAACALATCANIPVTAMAAVLGTFTGLPHRCQWVRALEDVVWINDSKGTNVGATLSAILGIGGSIEGKIVLIAGGQGKGADFTALQDVVQNFVRSVILIGEDADKLDVALHQYVKIQHADSLEAAVRLARAVAEPGDVVLLSPACASFDMFRDFNHRGEAFTQAVVTL